MSGRGGDPGRGPNYYTNPIGATRIEPLPVHEDGRPVMQWPCPRCGQRVDGSAGHVVRLAPCRDCREYLREEEGDKTIWDKRRLAELGAVAS